jgi:hypothetical protein
LGLDGLTDFLTGQIGIFIQERLNAHQQPWCAESALHAVISHKRLLDGAQRLTGAEPLDGLHLSAVELDRQHATRIDGFAVDDDGAGAALRGSAAFLGSLQLENVSDKRERVRLRGNFDGLRPAV